MPASVQGEVYRARDTKLERDVAIKVLPDEFANDAERLARFEREAKLLASLNHPNIASIHGFEESSGVNALVLELVEGPTLAERIAAGPIPVEEALAIAKQIAEALEAGHEAGVIHRDLKPANIKVRDDGTVKVLDYGLAKALEGEAPASGDSELSQSPTLTRQGTQVGVILGTAAYMSPEQAKGRHVDKRTDIWAFGVVVFEMLTGRQAFGASDVSQTLALVLTRELDWSALPEQTPTSVRRMLRRAVTRERKNRLGDMSDARLEIDDADASERSEVSGAPVLREPALGQRPMLAVAALVLALAISGLVVWGLTRPDPPLVIRMQIPLGEGESFTNRTGIAISPDGSNIVYTANNTLFLRPVDQLRATPMLDPGRVATSPFFSPDGEWVGYHSEGKLRKVAVSGGVPITLGDTGEIFGASWGEDGIIRFGQRTGDGIWQVPGAGGTPEQLIAVEQGEVAHGPQMLPGGEWVLFTLRPEGTTEWDQAHIVVQSVATGERRVVMDRGRDARYLPTGHLTYALNAVIVAVPFDLTARAVTGAPLPLVEGVLESFGAVATGAVHFSVANTGSLVYIPGSAGSGNEFELVWVDRAGEATPVGAEPRRYRWARVSPDGRKVAVHSLEDDNSADVWIYDLARGTLARLTFDEAFEGYPLWTPDGSRVVFQSLREGGGLSWKAADGTGEVERLLEHPDSPRPYGWSADGRLVFSLASGGIGVLILDGDRSSELVIETGTTPSVSPDGRWIAYSSVESGLSQIYVRPFPNVNDGRWQVSSDGGFDALWSPDGSELFFNTVPGLMVVQVETEPTFKPGTPERFPYRPGTPVSGTEFDIAPDGERFLFLKPHAESTEAEGLVFVLNWFDDLKRLIPLP